MANRTKPKSKDIDHISKSDIRQSAIATWVKLDQAIQLELDAILKGERDINASTAGAIIKFIEASNAIATSPNDISPKDQAERHAALMASLPTFDNETDN